MIYKEHYIEAVFLHEMVHQVDEYGDSTDEMAEQIGSYFHHYHVTDPNNSVLEYGEYETRLESLESVKEIIDELVNEKEEGVNN